ncbi:MAG: TetR/AcrR family transcriptional regulator [Verrucomicrobiota bacterium]
MKPGPEKQFDPEAALTAAMGVFRSRGYQAASLTELTQAMGIGKKSLYDTFGNKRALFLQSLELYAVTSTSAMRECLLTNPSPLAGLKKLMQQWKEMHTKPGSQGCMFGTNMADFDSSDQEVAGILSSKLSAIEDVFYEALQKAIKLGEISNKLDPRQTAQMLICLTQGFALIGRIQDQPAQVGSAVDSALEYITFKR